MYYFGGLNWESEEIDDFWGPYAKYHASKRVAYYEDQVWKEIGQMLNPRSSHSVVRYGPKVLVMGGAYGDVSDKRYSTNGHT